MSVLELVGTKLFVTLTLGIVGVFFVLNRVCGKKTGKESGESKSPGTDTPSAPKQADSSQKDTAFTKAELLRCRGEDGAKTYIAVKKIVFDVSANEMYAPGGTYHVFTGHDASRALAKMSLKPEDVDNDDLADLSLSERDVLDEWFVKFDTKYERVGRMAN